MFRVSISRLALLVLALCAIASPLAAGAADAFQGRALDADGAPVPAARVSAFRFGDRSTAPAASAIADQKGNFTLALQPGSYVIRIVADGCEAAEEVSVPAAAGRRDFFLQQVLRQSITVQPASGYSVPTLTSATKTATPLRDVPQSVTVVTQQLMQDQLMTSIGDVVRYVPGVMLHQGENNRDQIVMRGNSSSADFFVDGVRDDVQYYRDLYNLDRVEALKGPNAMIFGRGGAGGVINRVTKEAGFAPLRELSVQGGAWGDRRITMDFDQPLSDRFALRLNGLFEESGSFRDGVDLARSGIAPSLTFLAAGNTKVTLGYEHFHDRRAADRGISSYRGKPADVPIDTYYGNVDNSHVRANVDLASATVERSAGKFSIRNRTLFGDYDRGYQNYVPGAVSADKSRVAITAYNNATARRNLFNQADLTWTGSAGGFKHTVLAGAEIGRQITDNFRNTGFFDNVATSISVPYSNPAVTTPVTFRQNATDADNHLNADVAAIYAQDQIDLSKHLQFVAGVRLDRFDLRYHNNRNGDQLRRVDQLVSPRAGVIVEPTESLSLYGSASVSFLPGSGDQFSSLTSVTEQLQPERIRNYEVGVKWDRSTTLSVSGAVYRLDRTNTRSTDPNDPTRIVQTGSQRTDGYELGVNGRITPSWSIAGGYAHQSAVVTSATAAAREGARVAQVPSRMLSLWNNVDITPAVGAALGIVARSAMFAAIDDTVTLPGYAEFEAAGYYRFANGVRLQVNVDNLFDRRYYLNADSNTNISPGSPRSVRLAILTKF
jgi:catecholate siderophore receptor